MPWAPPRRSSTSARRSPTGRSGRSSWATGGPPTNPPPRPTAWPWRRSSRRPCERGRSASPPAARRCTGRRTASSCRAPARRPTSCSAIGDALARAGHGVFQFAPDHALVPVHEWPWMEALARQSGRTVSVNLNQPDQDPEVWRTVLGLLDQADGEGLDIVAQVAGRSIGILYCLHGSVHPLLFHPAYAEVAELPMAARLDGAGRPRAPPTARARGARRRRLLPAGGARQGRPDVAGGRARHRLRTGRIHLRRGGGAPPRRHRRWRCCSTS